MAHRDVLGDVILQFENLKFSSPLRREQNEDDNKENILGVQGIPKIKSVDTTSCTSTLPFLSSKDKTPIPLKSNKLDDISVDTYESPPSSPELRKSLQASDVGRSISPVTNFEENYNKLTYQNGILDQIITENEIEFDVHPDVTSCEEANGTFICEKNNSEHFLNSTFDATDAVNVIVTTHEKSDRRESVNSTIDFGSNKSISEACEKEVTVNTELRPEISEDHHVCHNLNTTDVKRQIYEQDIISSITSLDSEIKLKSEEKQLCSDSCVRIEKSLNSTTTLDSAVESEVVLDVTQVISNLPIGVEKETSGVSNIELDESSKEDIKVHNYGSLVELKKVCSSPNQCEVNECDAKRSSIREDTIVLNQFSVETAITEVNAPLHNISKEVHQDHLVSTPQNKKIEGENFLVCNQINSNQPESCDEILLAPNCEETRILNETKIKESINLSASDISQSENNTKLLHSPDKIITNENIILPKYKESEIENQTNEQGVEPEDDILNIFGNCEHSKSLIPSLVEVQNSVLITGDLKPSSIDSDFEYNTVGQIVEDFKHSAEVCVDTPDIISANHTEVESHFSEHSKNSDTSNFTNITKENTSPIAKTNVLSSHEPVESTEDVLKTDTFDNTECHNLKEFEENQVSIVQCEELVEVCRSAKLEEHSLERIEINLDNIDVGTAEKNECVQVLTEPDQEQNYKKLLIQKSSDIPQIIESDIGKMTEINENLQQEISDLKLELNAAKQAKATLELEIGKKDAIILMTQAESIKKEQQSQHDIKLLKEQLKEKSSINEKDVIKELEEALKESRARESQAVTELNARIVDVLNYRKIMEEYEKTIATRFSDFQKLKEENETVTRHLANLELSFSDLHQKYERTKTIIYGLKNNEDKLRKSLSTCEDSIHKQEERYESLKAHAKAQIEKSNKEIIKYREKYDNEVNKLNAIIKRLEIKSAALETSLDQKIKECTALSALCDEVTGKKV